MPNVIAQYNANMGGTDRMDQNIGKYRPSIRTKKWGWSKFVFSISSATQNSWLLHRQSESAKQRPMDYLSFLRAVAMSYIVRYRKTTSGFGRPRKSLSATNDDDQSRFSGDHFSMSIPKRTQRVCRYCGKKTTKMCSRRISCPLHEVCFRQYHTLP